MLIKTLLKHPHQANHVEGTSKILVFTFCRCHFDLLRKSDKLLRELKNLDNQKWYVIFQ